ncbi:MAG TPA: hemolysin family protein [Halanaerobiales bacterium]|nr:hemolysin family protein [Halanaerobiales bacterium]
MIINFIFLVVLLFLSAFFSGSETAFMAVNRVQIRDKSNKGDEKANLVDQLLEDETRLLTTILIGNNLVNIATSSIATSIAIELFGSKGVGIATGVVTLFILIFGEITPKSLGNSNSLKYAKIVAPFLYWTEKIFYPFVLFFSWIIKKVIGKENLISSAFITEEEIRRFVNVSEEEGVIKEIEKDMIQSVFDFDDTQVREIMVPRIDMVCIDNEADVKEVVELAVEYGHSRIPVYENIVDDIIGLIYVKDLLKLILSDEDEKDINLEEFIKPIYFIPESKPINTLLTEMQKRREHMAIVLDEYGGTSGLITIEDLLEEIVGDIQDEFDLETKMIEKVNENEMLVDARIDIDKVNEKLENSLHEEENFETISGFILHNLGYLPNKGEKIEINNLIITVEEVSEHRIEKVRIKSEKPLTF